MEKRVHILYSGMVQGVGFRFTAERVAANLRLKGWVKNLADGRVEAVLEGEEDKLTIFVEKIKSGPMRRYIRNAEIDWSEPTKEFGDFIIKF
ncbi:MAG: acylphosphatase [Candidatus Omnitrophica bacterium]|nr:acylphosphatase [Candidatus Omnitrophota bacterium]